MAPVVIMFRTIFWAVPAFMRLEPVRTSGPTSVTMAKWAARSSWELGLQVRAMVSAPRLRAYSTAAVAGADVEQSAALAEMGGHEVDGAGNLRQRVLDRCGDFGVFGIDDAGNLEGGFEVDVVGLGIGTFGGQVLQAAWLHSEFENN